MAMLKLTKRSVEAAAPGEYRDTELTGFVLRVFASGVRSFSIRWGSGKRKGVYALGRFGVLTVEEARARAKELLAGVARGDNPAQAKAAARKAWSISDLIAHYEAECLPRLRPASQESYKLHFGRYIAPEIGKMAVTAVASEDVLRLFRAAERKARKEKDGKLIHDGRTTANRVLATTSVLFGEARAQGLRTDNPCDGIKRNPENKRERFLTSEELQRLLFACERSPHELVAKFVRLLVYTGARRTETLRARWDQFDLQAGTWLKPGHATKQKKPHLIPLGHDAIEMLRDMRDLAPAGCPWLFPGSDSAKPLVSPKRAVRSIFLAAGLTADDGEKVVIHTLRHSFAASVVSGGHGLHVTGKLLGHTQAATTHRYAHLEQDPLRAALDTVEAHRLRTRQLTTADEPASNSSAEIVDLATARASRGQK